MALIKCPECGNQVSKSATSCPVCGKPMKKSTNIGCLIALILSILVVFGIIVTTKEEQKEQQSREEQKEQQSRLAPSVEVFKDHSGIYVKNVDTSNWLIMRLDINRASSVFHYWFWEGAAPKIGETKFIPFREFATRKGERFNPNRTKIQLLRVGGGGYDYKALTFK